MRKSTISIVIDNDESPLDLNRYAVVERKRQWPAVLNGSQTPLAVLSVFMPNGVSAA
ncbi:hypothetical protein RBA63_11360 [Brenneria goodwinii]|uniref:hypothetical protein n=1 Tax=Brenneria goodwinii TaxID=1109412 RepID=UPI0036EDAA13